MTILDKLAGTLSLLLVDGRTAGDVCPCPITVVQSDRFPLFFSLCPTHHRFQDEPSSPSLTLTLPDTRSFCV
jgi:hypothetical protein